MRSYATKFQYLIYSGLVGRFIASETFQNLPSYNIMAVKSGPFYGQV